jgi:hypothetical protein
MHDRLVNEREDVVIDLFNALAFSLVPPDVLHRELRAQTTATVRKRQREARISRRCCLAAGISAL